MEGLRQRVASCFLALLESPAFNAEAAALAGTGPRRSRPYLFTRHNVEYSGKLAAQPASVGVQTT